MIVFCFLLLKLFTSLVFRGGAPQAARRAIGGSDGNATKASSSAGAAGPSTGSNRSMQDIDEDKVFTEGRSTSSGFVSYDEMMSRKRPVNRERPVMFGDEPDVCTDTWAGSSGR